MKVDPLVALRMEVHSTIDSSKIFSIVDFEQLVKIHRHREKWAVEEKHCPKFLYDLLKKNKHISLLKSQNFTDVCIVGSTKRLDKLVDFGDLYAKKAYILLLLRCCSEEI